MSKSTCFTACNLILALVIGCFSGCGNAILDNAQLDDDPKRPLTFERMTPLADAYRNIGETLDLDNENREEFDRIYEKHKQKFETWYEIEGKELVGYQVDAINKIKNIRSLKFTGSGVTEEMKKRVQELKEQERKLHSDFELDLLAAIPDGKLRQWKCHRMSFLVLEFFDPLKLDDGQINSVIKLAPRALAMLKKDQRSNWQGYGSSKLETLAAKQVLKESQIEQYQKMKKRNFSRLFRWNNPSR
ncbi:MAG: hypothetical protein AAGA30_10180 [Planctomycetota bacterium]